MYHNVNTVFKCIKTILLQIKIIIIIILTLLTELSLHRRQQLTRSYSEKQRYDGWYNNLAHPQWGTVGKTPNLISPSLNSPN
jgi:tryptophan-rich sensory protein